MDNTPPAPNTITRDELVSRLEELGSVAGRGTDNQIKALLSVCEGGYHGVIDLKPNKHGAEKDDAVALAEAYVKSRSEATVFDHRAPNQRKLVSTFRTAIRLGQWPKGGVGEPLATVDRLIKRRQNIRRDPAQSKKLDDAANTFMRYARAQLRSDTLLDDTQLEQFCYRTQADPKTAEERVEALRRSVHSLVEGDRNGVQDNSPKVREALAALSDRLVEIAKAKGGKI